ncbi:MAG: hypothetical protein HC822_22190 [Oscillochloris sp.]|nr:hypothetical protein [Oscillochloris sp.]
MGWMLTLAIVGVIAFGGYVVAARPAWAEPYVAPLLGGNTPANVPALTTQQASYNLQVTVPSGSDQTTVLAEFRRAFEAAAQAQYGPTTQVSPNQPPASIGTPTLISDDGTTATYQATIQGLISRP